MSSPRHSRLRRIAAHHRPSAPCRSNMHAVHPSSLPSIARTIGMCQGARPSSLSALHSRSLSSHLGASGRPVIPQRPTQSVFAGLQPPLTRCRPSPPPVRPAPAAPASSWPPPPAAGGGRSRQSALRASIAPAVSRGHGHQRLSSFCSIARHNGCRRDCRPFTCKQNLRAGMAVGTPPSCFTS